MLTSGPRDSHRAVLRGSSACLAFPRFLKPPFKNTQFSSFTSTTPDVKPAAPVARLARARSCDRSDLIVLTGEAHRSQYDTLAMEMRAALPNALSISSLPSPARRSSAVRNGQAQDEVGCAGSDGGTPESYHPSGP